jgi:hypothetical protein
MMESNPIGISKSQISIMSHSQRIQLGGPQKQLTPSTSEADEETKDQPQFNTNREKVE